MSKKENPIELFPQKMKVFFFSFFRKSYTFLFLITCRKNFFEKIFSFCYFFVFCHFCSFQTKMSKNWTIFDQIYGTSTEFKKSRKMFIFRLQSVLTSQLCIRKGFMDLTYLGSDTAQKRSLNFFHFGKILKKF